MSKVREDLVGKKFGDWIVLKQGEEKQYKDRKVRTWTCKCTCGSCNEIIKDVNEKNLLNRKSNGCGKKSKIANGKNNKKYNKYNLSNEYGICYTDEGVAFYFDLEDYELIKSVYWREHKDSVNGYARGYLYTDKEGKHKYIFMHEIIMDSKNIDHKDGNTYDNRKENLRVCTEQENAMNKRTPKNNTSGVKGVHYAKKEEKWKAYITFKGKRIHLGTYTNIEDAINKRLKAEGKYFGEFNRGKI